jgi:hypothetical protein
LFAQLQPLFKGKMDFFLWLRGLLGEGGAVGGNFQAARLKKMNHLLKRF